MTDYPGKGSVAYLINSKKKKKKSKPTKTISHLVRRQPKHFVFRGWESLAVVDLAEGEEPARGRAWILEAQP